MNRIVPILILLLLSSAPMEAQTPATQSPASTLRPRLADSATGYIDNAIVGSQFRIRFDSGYGVNAPDRAERFYAKCGCLRFLPPGNPARDPDAPGPGGPGEIGEDLYYQELSLEMEYPVLERLSIIAEVPFRSIEPAAVPRTAGIGDVRVGFKAAIEASDERYLTAQLRTYIPSGDARRGLGTHHASVEPALLYHQKFGEGFALAGEVGDWHPIGGSAGVPTASDDGFAGDVFFYGFGGSYAFFQSSPVRVSPVVEFVGWRVLSGFQTLSTGEAKADGTNIANLKIGARIDTGGPGSFYIGVGHALTDSVWYEDLLRLEYRLGF